MRREEHTPRGLGEGHQAPVQRDAGPREQHVPPPHSQHHSLPPQERPGLQVQPGLPHRPPGQAPILSRVQLHGGKQRGKRNQAVQDELPGAGRPAPQRVPGAPAKREPPHRLRPPRQGLVRRARGHELRRELQDAGPHAPHLGPGEPEPPGGRVEAPGGPAGQAPEARRWLGVKGTGWLLDPYIEGKNVSMWLKTTDGGAVKLQERYTPTFMAEPRDPYTPDNLVYLFEEHPFVRSASIVSRFQSIDRRRKLRVVEVKVDSAGDLKEVLGCAERLREVREVYNSGLIPVQWHLIQRDLPPSSLCEFSESHGHVKNIRKLDDDTEVSPPPLKTLAFHVPDQDEITEVQLLDEDLKHAETIKGDERRVLLSLRERLLDADPDVVVTDSPLQTARTIVRKAWRYRIRFRFGRGAERYHGRVLLGLSGYADTGLAGLVERARFTYAHGRLRRVGAREDHRQPPVRRGGQARRPRPRDAGGLRLQLHGLGPHTLRQGRHDILAHGRAPRERGGPGLREHVPQPHRSPQHKLRDRHRGRRRHIYPRLHGQLHPALPGAQAHVQAPEEPVPHGQQRVDLVRAAAGRPEADARRRLRVQRLLRQQVRQRPGLPGDQQAGPPRHGHGPQDRPRRGLQRRLRALRLPLREAQGRHRGRLRRPGPNHKGGHGATHEARPPLQVPRPAHQDHRPLRHRGQQVLREAHRRVPLLPRHRAPTPRHPSIHQRDAEEDDGGHVQPRGRRAGRVQGNPRRHQDRRRGHAASGAGAGRPTGARHLQEAQTRPQGVPGAAAPHRRSHARSRQGHGRVHPAERGEHQPLHQSDARLTRGQCPQVL